MIQKIGQIVYFSNYKYDENGLATMNDQEQLELHMSIRSGKLDKAQDILKNEKEKEKFKFIASGSSPRGIESLLKASLCEAFLDGEEMVHAEHVKRAAFDVLRHRVRLKIQAKTQNITSMDIIETLLNTFLD